MRSTQLQTLRAVAAGNSSVGAIADELGIPYSSAAARLRTLARDGYVEQHGRVTFLYSLTDRARALLETRARLDGEAP